MLPCWYIHDNGNVLLLCLNDKIMICTLNLHDTQDSLRNLKNWVIVPQSGLWYEYDILLLLLGSIPIVCAVCVICIHFMQVWSRWSRETPDSPTVTDSKFAMGLSTQTYTIYWFVNKNWCSPFLHYKRWHTSSANATPPLGKYNYYYTCNVKVCLMTKSYSCNNELSHSSPGFFSHGWAK